VMPFWAALRRWASMRRALAGVGAAVVGLLIAALYDPLATEALRTPWDLLVAGVGIAALTVRRVPPVVVVVGSALAGQLLATVGAG
jgi:chromate transporter